MNLSQAEQIFHRALDLAEPEARAAYLNSTCAGQPALRTQVDQLLAAHQAPTGFLDTTPDIRQTIVDAVEESLGARIGRYKLLEKLGEGGCGVVYVAEQTEPVRRRVALKVIKLGMDTRAVVARFEAERQALAMMDHPNIAKVLDAGTTEQGRPYFVMELVRGIRITDYCDQNNLSTKDRLDLFIKICHAIQHAHQKGIIHRDIKPSNILVTLHDGVPIPKVIDFGIAKATEGRLTDVTVYTQLHQFIGTPAYMSPEQAEMSALDVDTRSDIYSLGVLLYELLTGDTPFDGKALMASGIDGMRKTIREKEPVRPSTRLTQKLLATAAQSVPSKSQIANLKSQIHSDLDWIVMKCLEKDRTRRYETANGLAADLKRHLNSEPVIARPPSAVYKFQKAIRRNKLIFATGATVTAAFVIGTFGTTFGFLRAREERSAALQAQKLAEQRFEAARLFVDDVVQKVEPEFADLIGASKAREVLARTSVKFLESLGSGITGDEAFEASLAGLYRNLADSLGGLFASNTLGDYEGALNYCQRALAIAQKQYDAAPHDTNKLANLAIASGRMGTILAALERPQEALKHQYHVLDLTEQILTKAPGDTNARALAERRIELAHWHIGGTLIDLGRTQEALDQHYIPYTADWLSLPLELHIPSEDAQRAFIAPMLLADALIKLDRPAEALPYLDKGRDWKKLLIDRNPNNARWARDWSSVHNYRGRALVALGKVEEGIAALKEAVRLAETLTARDPANGLAQETVIEFLRNQASACAKQAARLELSIQARAGLWRETIYALTRCSEKMQSPPFDSNKAKDAKIFGTLHRELTDARVALAALLKE